MPSITTVMEAKLPDIPAGTGDIIAMKADLASALSGDMKLGSNVTGSLTQSPTTRGKGLVVESSGTYYKIKFKNSAQEKRHEELHNALTRDPRDYGPDAVINVSRGWIEVKGHIVEYLHDKPKKAQLLHEMRMLYHEALGQRYSDIVWHDYVPNDRASTSDPLSLQQRNIAALTHLPGYHPNEIHKDQFKGCYLAQNLPRKIVDIIDKQKDTIGVSTSTEAESRKAQLAQQKETFKNLYELVLGYHAAHNPPDLSKLLDDHQAKYDAIKKYRADAHAYLTQAVKDNDSYISLRKDSNKPDVKEAIDKLALEMALTACTTRKDYDNMCLVFETKPCRTSPEMFVMKLSQRAAATGDDVSKRVEEHIDDHFDIAFNGLTYQEDKEKIHRELAKFITDVNSIDKSGDERLKDASSPAAYNARMEQLVMVKKQETIAEAQKGLAKKLEAKRPDLANLVNAMADELVTLGTTLKSVESKDEAYKPIAGQIPGYVKRQGELIEQIGADPSLRPVVNEFNAIQRNQVALEHLLATKKRT